MTTASNAATATATPNPVPVSVVRVGVGVDVAVGVGSDVGVAVGLEVAVRADSRIVSVTVRRASSSALPSTVMWYVPGGSFRTSNSTVPPLWVMCVSSAIS